MPVDIENINSLQYFLLKLGLIEPGEKISLQVLHGGVSNKTVLVHRKTGDQWVIKQALLKLRVMEDWYCEPERLEIEFKAMKWFSEVLPDGYVPKPVFFNKESNILGMMAVPQPHSNLKTLLLNGIIDSKLISEMGTLLGNIHKAGKNLAQAKSLFGEKSFFKTLRLEAYYEFTSAQLPESKPFFDTLISETLETDETVVHGDFSPKNILVADGKLILLDHEVMHYGDPAFDIGFCLTHLLSKANHLDECRNHFREAAHIFWRSYRKIYITGNAGEYRAARHTLACLLSRIKGRSPLEYLNKQQQENQLNIGLQLINNISGIPELIESYITALHKQ